MGFVVCSAIQNFAAFVNVGCINSNGTIVPFDSELEPAIGMDGPEQVATRAGISGRRFNSATGSIDIADDNTRSIRLHQGERVAKIPVVAGESISWQPNNIDDRCDDGLLIPAG